MMMLSNRLSLVLCLALIATTLPSIGETAQLKIATIAPDGSFWMNEVKKGAAEIEEKTEGRVKVRIYPGGTMGNDQAVLRKMRIGQLQGGMIVASSLATVTPGIQVYGLPLVFRSYDEVDHVRAKVDAGLVDALAAKGYVSFGIIEGGFAYIMSNKPTTGIASLKGRKAWIPEGDSVAEAILQSAGLSAVPLPVSDVLTGLQTGLIDTVAGPPVGAVALQWFTRTKYLTDLPILYSYGMIVVSEKAFLKLTETDQKVVREVMGKVTQSLDGRTRTDNERARVALAKQGIEFVTISPEERENWRKVAAAATAKLDETGAIPTDLLAEVRGYLATFREAKD
jgi:TRAP-type C4-dicarboxylate transport system substrate-binding protein